MLEVAQALVLLWRTWSSVDVPYMSPSVMTGLGYGWWHHSTQNPVVSQRPSGTL